VIIRTSIIVFVSTTEQSRQRTLALLNEEELFCIYCSENLYGFV